MRIHPRRALSLPTLLLGFTAAALLPACSHATPGAGAQPALIPSISSPIADVPVPAGFTMSGASTSQIDPGRNLRFVDHRYNGDDDVLPVVRFYRDQLPTKGWTLVDQNQLHHEVTLRFTKNAEDCTVTVWPGTLDTHIRIRINPAASAAPAAPAAR